MAISTKLMNTTYQHLESTPTATLAATLVELDEAILAHTIAVNDPERPIVVDDEYFAAGQRQIDRKRRATMIRRELGRRRRLGLS